MTRIHVYLLATTIFTGCQYIGGGVRGSGIAKTETRDVGAIDEINFEGAGRLEITVGKTTPLTITGDDNIVPLIGTTVSGHRLTIKPKQSIEPKSPLVFQLGTTDLKMLDCSGAAKIFVTGVNNKSLKVDVSGAGLIKVAGRTEQFELTISGAANAEADELIAREVAVELSGAGKADVHATEKLKATVSGAGVIRYRGDPKVEKSVSGVGTVTKK